MNTPFQLYKAFKISIIEDSIENVENYFNSFLTKFNLTTERLKDVDFNSVCSSHIIPYIPSDIKFILYEPLTNPGKTIFFSNFGGDGWYTAVYNYISISRKSAYHIGFSNDQEASAYSFHYFYFKNNKATERSISAIKDDKWIFYEKGDSLNIEDRSNYQKRKIVDRLNNKIILEYLLKAGYNLTDMSFYCTSQNPQLFKSKLTQ